MTQSNFSFSSQSQRRFCLILLISIGLQSCIAAAIPVIAGGAAIGSEASRNKTQTSAETPQPAKIEKAPENKSLKQIALESIEKQQEAKQQETTSNKLDSTKHPSSKELTELDPAYARSLQEMASYAFGLAAQNDTSSPRQSAVLTNSSSLDGKRKICAGSPNAVLIDLDPKSENFDPATLAPTYDGDALGHLSRLRESGVTIAWLSTLSADKAGAVRKALQISGLDVTGEDSLLLMRYSDDRKQTRRAEFASQYCLLAIAGDELTDFDELYDYLLNRDKAFRLKKLINNGWFLLPSSLPTIAEPKQQPEPKPSLPVSETVPEISAPELPAIEQ